MLGKYGLVLLKLLVDGLLPRGSNRRCNETVHSGRQKFETEGTSVLFFLLICPKFNYCNIQNCDQTPLF